MRSFLRFLALLSLALTLVFGVVDLASAGESMVFRTLGAHWLSLHAPSLQDIHDTLTANGPSLLWGGMLLPILSQPAIVVFGCLAVIFLALAMLAPSRHARRRYDDDAGHD